MRIGFYLKNSLIKSVIVSVLIAAVVTLLEWFNNPSGIFHDNNGTHWSFVMDTFSSWWWPLMLCLVLINVFVNILHTSKGNKVDD
ncbi:hypothetical protein [Neptunicella marina]|uniref:Uncharacterized protein n=1 Tax=Neptunicella marina TaxID=2125989 RepID=A0A8J6IWT4_9ALTE|nr:hypothetical protein [Neptunicella marina]MBC3767117.1 hypothetical protein [Neptunicella marina]